ncbi:60 kDa heat shock protein homolog 1, mitochondrial [Drosophila subobscura]|uniref:60 kDa heat shock protein homolog 1, mitochondrial n=1 Tax=Drosophila subobscura TaxID=7241 RepID=UPI00155A3F8B|nr:60 kDa heat shock protein homolog 1, mitochondrial [Drosophila subobscura]
MSRHLLRANRNLLKDLRSFYSKDVRFGAEARAMMIRGVDLLADAVSVTMGPKGRSVIVERPWTSPKITKDGYTVARAIALKDQHMNMGARLVQDVADNTNKTAGDGTTTATVLARAIVKGGFQQFSNCGNPLEVRTGVLLAVESVKQQLKQMSRPVQTRQEIEQVATISANGDEDIGRLIGEATDRVGPKGTITVKEGRRLKDELHVIQGLHLDTGYLSPYFVNTPKGSKVEFGNALVLICLKKITSLSQILQALEQAQQQRRPLIIIAEDISGEAMSALVLNKLQAELQVCAVKSPSYGPHRKELLGDIAAATGATIFGDDIDFARVEDAKLQDMGQVGEAIITKSSTLLLQGKARPAMLKLRIEQIQDELEDPKTKSEQSERLRQRLSALTKGVAVLHIGGSSEVEVSEKKDRVTDALNATRAAIEEGIVPGGGTAFLRCIAQLEALQPRNKDHQKGIDIVCQALRMPSFTIAQNAGVDAATVVAQVLNGSGDYGYDAMRNEFGSLLAKGIIDPTKVLRTAIADAAGVASLLGTTEVVITDIRNSDLLAKLAGMAGGMGGGMDMGGMGGMAGLDGMSEMDALAALSGAMGGMEGMSGMGGGGSSSSTSAADMNELVQSMPGMEDVEVHDIDASMME